MSKSASFSIALVDDYAPLHTYLKRIFKAAGIRVLYEAKNGQDFLDQLSKSSIVPDTCLLDINMPVMDGYETASTLRLHFPSVQILAYSSDSDSATVEKILAHGAHGFIEKGRHPNDYVEALVALHDGPPRLIKGGVKGQTSTMR